MATHRQQNNSRRVFTPQRLVHGWLIFAFCLLLAPALVQAAQIPFTGLETEQQGAAGWNSDGSGTEPANTGHAIGWTSCVSNAFYYLASRDFGGIDPASSGGLHGIQSPNGFAGFVAALAANGYSIDELTMTWGPQSLGNDVQGQDWLFDPATSTEVRLYTGGNFMLRLRGEDLVGDSMPRSTITIKYNIPSDCNDDQVSGQSTAVIPENRSSGSSTGVQAVAAAFLADLGNDGIRFVFDSFQPAGQQPQFSANGRVGAFFDLQSGRIETAPVLVGPIAWGLNEHGQLGDDSTTSRSNPVQVVGLSDVEAVAASVEHSLALKADGTVWSWGHNSQNELGDGSTTTRQHAVQVHDPSNPAQFLGGVSAIATGIQWNATLKDGNVWTWGRAELDQLGRGGNTAYPGKVELDSGVLSDVVAIAAGGYHGLALKADGTVWAWGHNTVGQLGDGTRGDRSHAVQVKDPNDPSGFLTGIKAIAAGMHFSLALKMDGTVWGWGNNAEGQLGYGSIFVPDHNFTLVPVQAKDPTDPTGFLTDVTAISAGYKHALALKSDGRVRSWGLNADGQLGDGSTITQVAPVTVHGPGGVGTLDNVISIAGGDTHTLAIRSDGTVWAWGDNEHGELGNGCSIGVDCVDSSTPVQVSGLNGVSAISAGRYFSLAAAGPVALPDDGDGIAAEVDVDNANYSDRFRNGATEGDITDRGDQNLTVTASNGGVRIEAAADGGSDPATISACGGTVVIELSAGSAVTITCGSAIVRTEYGNVSVTFLANGRQQARLNLPAGHQITFNSDALTITADSNNSSSLTVTTDREELTIAPGAKAAIVESRQGRDWSVIIAIIVVLFAAVYVLRRRRPTE